MRNSVGPRHSRVRLYEPETSALGTNGLDAAMVKISNRLQGVDVISFLALSLRPGDVARADGVSPAVSPRAFLQV